MDLSEAVKRIKRKTSLGTLTKTTDQVTLDIIDAINDRMDDAWRFHDWNFELNALEISLVADQSDYTLSADDGDIFILYPEKQGQPLRRYTFREWLEYRRRETEDGNDTGTVFGYQILGRNSSKQLKIRLLRTPNAANSGDKIIGFAKNRITKYTVADIATNTSLDYFPREMHPLIVIGAESNMLAIQKKPDAAARKDRRFFAGLQLLVDQETNEPDDIITTRIPKMIVRRRRHRSGTNVT